MKVDNHHFHHHNHRRRPRHHHHCRPRRHHHRRRRRYHHQQQQQQFQHQRLQHVLLSFVSVYYFKNIYVILCPGLLSLSLSADNANSSRFFFL